MIRLAEQGFVPNFLIRQGIRYFVAKRLRDEREHDIDFVTSRYRELLKSLSESPIALSVEQANEQHYEVPTSFFQAVLGPALKYSCAYWDDTTKDLAEAEEHMLKQYSERAEIEDGMSILDLGCGWGSFSIWAARNYPNCSIVAVSNSSTQKSYIDEQTQALGLTKLTAITSDVNSLAFDRRFDRVISIEMFEHVRNYAMLMRNISNWLHDDGRLFVHMFCHRYMMYPFEWEQEDDWIAKLFFANGLMPSRDTLLHFQRDLVLEDRWELSGEHYKKTATAWIRRLKRNRAKAQQALQFSGASNQRVEYNRWLIFFMACEELFGWDRGSSWLVSHYLFSKRK